MAVDFGNTLIEGGIEPSVKVQNPVADNSGAILAKGFAPAAQAVGQVVGNIFKQNAVSANAKIITNYQNDLLDLADAVDQGLSRNEAMIKARNLRRQYLANAPALQEDFDKVWTKFADSNGLGHVVVEGTVEQQGQDALTKDAISKGYTPDEYKLFLSRANEAAAINQQIDMLKAQGGVITETERLKSVKAVTGLAQSAYPSAQKQINDAMAQITANPNNKAEIAANLNSVIGGSIAQLEYLSGNAEDTAYITTPIKTLMSTFNDWVSGKVTNEVMDGQIKATQNKYDLMYQSDPTLGPIIAQSKLLGSLGLDTSVLSTQLWTPEALQRLKQVMTPNGNLDILDNTEGSARFVDNIKQVAGSITPNSDPELIKEVSDSLNKMVDGAYVNERTAGGPLGFKDTVETLGSPEIGSFLAQHGGISAKYKDQFVGVLKSNYENELLPVIDNAWNGEVPLPSRISMGNMGVGTIATKPMSELIEPRWNGNAVEFVPKAEYANDADVARIARDATTGDNSIAVPLNNLINAYANVTGTDAKQIYEQDFAGRLFNVGEETQTKSSTNPTSLMSTPTSPSEPQSSIPDFTTEEGLVNNPNAKEFTLKDFQPEELHAIVSETSAKDASGVLNSNNPIDFAKAFIGKNEANADDVKALSSFIRETAGINIDPSKTAWCAAFVDAVLHASGGSGTGKLNARSYLNWGVPVDTPKVGDVVVLQRGAKDGWQGHVGFYAGTNPDGTIKILGGNQGDSVSLDNFDSSKVLGYRRAS